ncbi:hypothetical protein CGCF413_v007001 [Colletotrichum fructicola]|nr:hypothetical protein CGCF413_v007001 [Colletotrichum fructicola]
MMVENGNSQGSMHAPRSIKLNGRRKEGEGKRFGLDWTGQYGLTSPASSLVLVLVPGFASASCPWTTKAESQLSIHAVR